MTDPALAHGSVLPRETPLADRHRALGASFTDFGGWLMPVRYQSDLAEHHAIRRAAGLFDISHMAEFTAAGPDAGAFLDYALAGRLSAIAVGKAKYSLLLAESGGIIDDVIVYRLAGDRYLVIANAGNRAPVATALAGRASAFDVVVEDVSDAYALLAVQGPAAAAIVATVGGITEVRTPWDRQRNYTWTDARFDGEPMLIARTGYTGEDGFELLVPVAVAERLWDAVTAAGQPHGLVPAGLAARDTLRLEAGMPLYGHELSLNVVPAQAGLARVVAGDKESFVGQSALASIVSAGSPVLVGLVSDGRRAGRAGYTVHSDEEQVGVITSGALSPTLGRPIAMAFVDPAVAADGTVLTIDVRGTRIPATVTALPFYRRTK